MSEHGVSLPAFIATCMATYLEMDEDKRDICRDFAFAVGRQLYGKEEHDMVCRRIVAEALARIESELHTKMLEINVKNDITRK